MKKILFYFASVFLLLLVALSLIQGFFFPEVAITQNIDAILLSPSTEHWFGTDSLGRSLFWRILAGTRVSLTVGVLCPFVVLIIGSCYGFISGWAGGFWDRLLMRICDIFIALPSFLLVSILALVVSLMLPEDWGLWKALIVLGMGISATHWMLLARVARARVLEIRVRPYVEAARALGGTPAHILWKHILPNTREALLITACLQIPSCILYESFMSFIGLGVQAPQTSWGLLIKDGWQSLSTYPYLILLPSLILFLTVWSLHIMFDHLFDQTSEKT